MQAGLRYLLIAALIIGLVRSAYALRKGRVTDRANVPVSD